jgi:hypothetical protein
MRAHERLRHSEPERWQRFSFHSGEELVGAVADFGGYDGDGNGLRGSVLTYLFGPRITPRLGKIQPFVQVLFGGAHTTPRSSSVVGSAGAGA